MSVRPIFRWLPDVAMGAVYFVLAALSIKLTRFDGGIAFVSIANAVLLARLLTLRPERWGSILTTCALASTAAASWAGLSVPVAALMAALNVSEAVIAAVVLSQVTAGRGRLGARAPLPWFLFAAGVAAPAIIGCGAAAIVTAQGVGSYASNWLNWYTGHALGGITFTPVAVYLLRGDRWLWYDPSRRWAAAEAAALTLLVALTTVGVFVQNSLPLLFLPLLPIILATFRGGRLAAAVSVMLLAVIGGWLTATGHGPIGLVHGSEGARIQFLQFYLACTVLTMLPVGAELARRQALYRRLHDSEARYRLLTENSTDIVLNLDVNGRIRFASPAIRQIGGYDPAAVIGRNATELIDPADVGRVTQTHLAALADPSRTHIVEYRAPTAAGESRWFETHTRAVLNEEGRVTGVVSAVRDVGHRKTVEQRLAHAALTDRLTGIANRRAFDAQLDVAVERAGADGIGCVALFDLDHFKQVNDGYGHAAGDAVLRSFAELMRGRMREMDFVARFGGEEFAAILPGASPEQARLICDRLRGAVAETAVIAGGARIRVTVSGGVAAYGGGMTAEGALAAADAALYEAKRAGRDRLALAA